MSKYESCSCRSCQGLGPEEDLMPEPDYCYECEEPIHAYEEYESEFDSDYGWAFLHLNCPENLIPY